MRVVLRGATIVNDDGMTTADVACENEKISEVGTVAPLPDDHVIDASGRYLLPGFVDAHSHADGQIFNESIQLSLLRQGVTTVICGQDGVSYAPGDGAYAQDYFATIDGPHPTYSGGGVGQFLELLDGTTRLNGAYLVPAGTVRWEVCGASTSAANAEQTAAMAAMVAQGMADGAVGLSTGLDYVPGLFAGADEIAALCVPVSQAGGVYVSHMRGGYGANSFEGIDEIRHISQATGVAAHVSHFQARPEVIYEQMEALAAAGVDATFDTYPYTRSSTLLSMKLLPPELCVMPAKQAAAALRDPAERERLRQEWFTSKEKRPESGWPTTITLAHVPSPDYSWAPGLTIEQAAKRAGTDAIGLVLDLLAACEMNVNVVAAVSNPLPVSELAKTFSHPAHMAGSDGIFIGAHPHPRARATFTHFIRQYVREMGAWTWPDAAKHLSSAAASRFSLGRRGRIEPGWVADLVAVDPETVADQATYERPLEPSVGIDDVLVAGVPVLANGELTRALPGRGLRRNG